MTNAIYHTVYHNINLHLQMGISSVILINHFMPTAPSLNITDDSGRTISGERHLKAGSTLRLRCEGRDVLERLNESLLWTRGDEILTTDVRLVSCELMPSLYNKSAFI